MGKLFLFVLLPFTYSCITPRYSYAPARVNAPMLQGKNEMQLDASIATLKGFDASAAYALGRQLGVMINGSWRADRQEGHGNTFEPLPPDEVQYHRSSFDLGVGWFQNFKTSQIEIYAGVGAGQFSMRDYGNISNGSTSTPYERNYRSHLQRIFIQPAFGVNPYKNIQFIFFCRFLFQHYGTVNTNYSSEEMRYYLIPQSSDPYYFFAEPGVSFRFYLPSLPMLGFEANSLLSRPTSSLIYTIPVHLSIGVHARFGARSRPKQS
jgi:hypothetical protein